MGCQHTLCISSLIVKLNILETASITTDSFEQRLLVGNKFYNLVYKSHKGELVGLVLTTQIIIVDHDYKNVTRKFIHWSVQY